MQYQPTFPHQIELFVIQRCWFSGPNVEPTVDCRRLFTSRREAEEVAYHSAHAFANQRIFSTNYNHYNNNNGGGGEPTTRQHVNAAVKTILLPPSASGTTTSSYAFATCGKIFWVRPLKATIVPHIGNNQAAGLTYPLHVPTLGHATATNTIGSGGGEEQVFPFATAEVILTEGVIGGTGNPNSRRGSEVPEGRVFVSTDPANANRCAVEAARQLHLTMAHNPHVRINVMCVPIGKANNNTVGVSHCHGLGLEDWPAVEPHRHHHQQQQQQQWSADPMMTIMADPSTKREWAEWAAPAINNNTASMSGGMEYDPRANPNLPSKRQCQVFRQETTHEAVAPCGMMF